MKYLLSFALGLFLSTGSVIAEERHAVPVWPVIHFCATGAALDSYGLGIRAGYLGLDQRATLREEWTVAPCFSEGVGLGFELAHRSDSFCARDWEMGLEQGFAVTPVSVRSPCFSAAYTAGLALRRAGARRGDVNLVGPQCTALYTDGFRDGAANHGVTPDAPAAARACYDAGFWDATEMNSLR